LEREFKMSYPSPHLYPALAFIGPIPMIKGTFSNGTVYFVPDWKNMSQAAKARRIAEIDYVEDCCWNRERL